MALVEEDARRMVLMRVTERVVHPVVVPFMMTILTL